MYEDLLDQAGVGSLPPAQSKFMLGAFLGTPGVHLAHSFHTQQAAPQRGAGTSAVAPKR